jgi:hypothetical protein
MRQFFEAIENAPHKGRTVQKDSFLRHEKGTLKWATLPI